MNTCTYQITTYSFTPSKNIFSLEERKQKFKHKLQNWASYNDLEYKEYPKWLRKEFFEYWSELANDKGRKMRFEMEKTWNTGRRLATAKRTIYAKDPRWKLKKRIYTPPKKSPIDYGRIDYEKRKKNHESQNIDQIMTAGERLKKNWK